MMPDDAIATPIWPDPAATGSHRVTALVLHPEMCGTGLTLRRSSNRRRRRPVSIRLPRARRSTGAPCVRKTPDAPIAGSFGRSPGRRPLNHPCPYRDGSDDVDWQSCCLV
jgi:hypothetical protein